MHDQKQPTVSVIIPARNAAATLRGTLEALRRQGLGGHLEVIVVDDGSEDETAVIAESFAPLVKLIRNERSAGAGAARNAGVKAAEGEVLAFTDADCVPTRDWLECGLEALRHADLVQGAVSPDPATPRSPFDRTLVVDRDRSFFQTANLFVRREVFDTVPGFRDWAREEAGWWRFSPNGPSRRAAQKPVGEDTLFGWMACRAGARSSFAADALVFHAVFSGGVLDDMADRWHWARDMPGLTKLVPELRETTFYRRWFFNRWTAQFDLALAGLVLAAGLRQKPWLLATLPYARRVALESRRYGRRRAVKYALGTPFVEATTLAGLLVGSVAWRRLVL